MKLPRRYLVHTVTVRPYLGRTSTVVLYGAAFQLRCMAQGKRRMVRDADGAETLSYLTLFCALEDAPLVPPGSEVTWSGDTTTVLDTTAHDDAGMGAPQHTEVVCE